MVWSSVSVGNASWVGSDGFGIVVYGEVLYGLQGASMIWGAVSTGNAGWV